MSTRWGRLAPLTGVVFVALLIASNALGETSPDNKASAAKVMSFYGSHSTKIAVAAYITGVSLFVGLLFYGVLRDRLSRDDASRGLAGTMFGGAVLFAVGGGLIAGCQLALAEASSSLSPGAAEALNLLANNLPQFAMGGGIAVLLVTAGVAILRGAALPGWLGAVGIVIGLAALTPAAFGAFMAAGLWTLAVSVMLLRRQPQVSASVGGPAMGSASLG